MEIEISTIVGPHTELFSFISVLSCTVSCYCHLPEYLAVTFHLSRWLLLNAFHNHLAFLQPIARVCDVQLPATSQKEMFPVAASAAIPGLSPEKWACCSGKHLVSWFPYRGIEMRWSGMHVEWAQWQSLTETDPYTQMDHASARWQTLWHSYEMLLQGSIWSEVRNQCNLQSLTLEKTVY